MDLSLSRPRSEIEGGPENETLRLFHTNRLAQTSNRQAETADNDRPESETAHYAHYAHMTDYYQNALNATELEADTREIAREEMERFNGADDDGPAVETPTPTDDSGGGSGSGQLNDVLAELRRVRLAYDPDNTGYLNTGQPRGGMHYSVGWGPVYQTTQPVHIRGATIEAAEAGTVTLDFYELSTTSEDADVLSGPYRTRRLEVTPGRQYVHIEVTLPTGVWFVPRRPPGEGESIVGLMRTTDNNRARINDSPAPVEWLRGWHPDFRPRHKDAHGRYQANDWASNYHYLFNLEVGWQHAVTDGGAENGTENGNRTGASIGNGNGGETGTTSNTGGV